MLCLAGRIWLVIWQKVEPWLDSLRSDPRYFEILKKITG